MPLGHGRVRLFQPVAQRNVVATLAILEVADLLSGGREETDLLACHSRLGERLCAADASCFTLWDHAYCNADFYDGRVAAEPLEPAPFEEFLELLLDAAIVADCWPPQYDLVKRGFGDRFKGSFYEQVGTQCLWERTVPTQWWLGQKFTPDAAETRPTPYRYVQEAFLDGYFPAALAGKEVLEVGCGSGYYTRKMSAHARTAVGMDYNADYVAVAREKWPPSAYPNLEFHVGNIIDLAAGSGMFLGRRFDAVVLIDTFLFLFHPAYQKELYENRRTIVANLRQLLKPGGELLIMDPHPFWLTPWIGLEGRPLGVLTEYRSKRFKVVPTLEEFTTLVYEGGFRIRPVLEPPIEEAYRARVIRRATRSCRSSRRGGSGNWKINGDRPRKGVTHVSIFVRAIAFRGAAGDVSGVGGFVCGLRASDKGPHESDLRGHRGGRTAHRSGHPIARPRQPFSPSKSIWRVSPCSVAGSGAVGRRADSRSCLDGRARRALPPAGAAHHGVLHACPKGDGDRGRSPRGRHHRAGIRRRRHNVAVRRLPGPHPRKLPQCLGYRAGRVAVNVRSVEVPRARAVRFFGRRHSGPRRSPAQGVSQPNRRGPAHAVSLLSSDHHRQRLLCHAVSRRLLHALAAFAPLRAGLARLLLAFQFVAGGSGELHIFSLFAGKSDEPLISPVRIENNYIDALPMLLDCYYRGWLDHLHSWSHEAVPGYPLVLPLEKEFASDGEATLPLKVTQGVQTTWEGFEIKLNVSEEITAFELTLVDHEGLPHFIVYKLPLAGRQGWDISHLTRRQLATFYLYLDQEANPKYLRSLGEPGEDGVALKEASLRVRSRCGGRIALGGLRLFDLTRAMVQRHIAVLRRYNVLPIVATQHGGYSSWAAFVDCGDYQTAKVPGGGDRQFALPRPPLGARPETPCYLADLQRDYGLMFLLSSGDAFIKNFPVGIARVPAHARRRHALLRGADADGRGKDRSAIPYASAKHQHGENVGSTIATFLAQPARFGETRCLYTHFNMFNPEVFEPPAGRVIQMAEVKKLHPYEEAGFKLLSNAMYDLDHPHKFYQRVWACPVSVLMRFRQVNGRLAEHTTIQGDSVRVTPWKDEVSGRLVPDPQYLAQDLHGQTFYVPDSSRCGSSSAMRKSRRSNETPPTSPAAPA